MRITKSDRINTLILYIGKIAVVAILYSVSADLGDLLNFFDVFNHGQYPPYWPPAGIALAFMFIWGPSVWPGIAIASLWRIPESYWFLESAPGTSDIIIVSSAFVAGRILEPVAGYYLFRKMSGRTDPFNCPRSAINFIITAIATSTIAAALSSTGIQIARPSEPYVYLVRMGAWWIDSLVGMLVFTPFLIAVHYFLFEPDTERRGKKSAFILVVLAIIIGAYLCYSSHPEPSSFHVVIINCFPFLSIPLLFWLAFKYHTAISTTAVILTSFVTVYFTTHGIGPFVMNGDWQNSVLLLQSFLSVATISILISSAVANERQNHERQLELQAAELQKANESLRSAMKHLEDARNKAEESDQLKSAFLTNISHEIRTPMNAVLGFAELLERPDLQSEKRESFINLIRKRSRDLLVIMNHILNMSMLTTGQTSSVATLGNMHEFLQRLLVEFKSETSHLENKDISITITTDMISVKDVRTDFYNLRHVLMNLLANSAKFTKSGFIEINYVEQAPNWLVFSVRDSGIGIPAEQLHLIFKPFRHASREIQQQYGGSGLGLAICKGFVQLWGGNIWVESSPQEGTAFHFTIPYTSV